MKIAIIHLSDFHLEKKPDNLEELIQNSIIPSVLPFLKEAEKCFVLFTGDLAKAGTTAQIDAGSSFFEVFRKGLLAARQELQVSVVAVPGNHDVNWPDKKRGETVIGLLNEEEKKKLFTEDIESMASFFKWNESENGLFSKDNRLSYSFDDGDLFFALFNSAPLSGSEHNDKDSHLMPEHIFPKVVHRPKGCFSFFLMHHRPDWFEEESKERLDAFIEKHVSMAFFGHEHKATDVYVEQENRKLLISRGGELRFLDEGVSGSFNAFLLNSETGKINCARFVRETGEAEEFKQVELRSLRLSRRNIERELSDDFLDNKCRFKLITDEEEAIDINDVFVMPFVAKASDPTAHGLDYDGLLSLAKRREKLILRGLPGIGKSILLTKLFRDVAETKLATFMDLDEIAFTNNPKKMVVDSIKSCYMDNLVHRFDAVGRTERYVFIDRPSGDVLSKKAKAFWEYFGEYFGHIIIAETTDESALPIDTLKRDVQAEEDVYSVYGVSLAQRKMMIERICRLKGVNDPKDIANVVNVVTNTMNSASLMDSYAIPSLVELTVKTITSKSYLEKVSPDSFQTVFVSNLLNLIRGIIQDSELEFAIKALAFLAYGIVRSEEKRTTFSFGDFERAFEKARDYEGSSSYSPVHLIEDLLETGVILGTGKESEYRFTKTSYLAYFAARGYSLIQNSSGHTQEIQSLAENIGVGLNADILLFLFYEKRDIRPIDNLIDLLEKSLSKVKELDFDKPNIFILNRDLKYPTRSVLEIEAERDRNERLDKAERSRRIAVAKREGEILAEPKTDQVRLLDKWISGIMVLSKAATASIDGIDAKKRENMIYFVISSLFKVFYALFNIDQETMKDLEVSFQKAKQTRDAKNELKDELAALTAADLLFDFLNTFILNVVTGVSAQMTSRNVDKVIKGLNCDSFSLLLFKLTYFERKGDFQGFVSTLQKADESGLNRTERYMIARVAAMLSSTGRLSDEEKTR